MGPEPAPDNEIFYRAILRKEWFDPDDPNRVKPEAFFRRRTKVRRGVARPGDEDGLSLFRASKIEPIECAHSFNECFGVVSIDSRTLEAFGLVIVNDPEDDRKVLLQNVPYENPGDTQQEKLVGDIAEAATIIVKGEYRRR